MPPHFHATYGDCEVLVSIKDLEVLEGNFPSKQLKMLLGWATIRQDQLMENWELATKRQELFAEEFQRVYLDENHNKPMELTQFCESAPFIAFMCSPSPAYGALPPIPPEDTVAWLQIHCFSGWDTGERAL